MRTLPSQEKSSMGELKDWHSADIIAGLKKVGTNMSALSEKHGLSRGCLRNALYRRYPKAEKSLQKHWVYSLRTSGLLVMCKPFNQKR